MYSYNVALPVAMTSRNENVVNNAVQEQQVHELIIGECKNITLCKYTHGIIWLWTNIYHTYVREKVDLFYK